MHTQDLNVLHILCQRVVREIILRKSDWLPQSSPARLDTNCSGSSEGKFQHLLEFIIFELR